jgi:hypothetical protein
MGQKKATNSFLRVREPEIVASASRYAWSVRSGRCGNGKTTSKRRMTFAYRPADLVLLPDF